MNKTRESKMNKRIDVSVLPDGFLIESKGSNMGRTIWVPNYMNSMFRTYEPHDQYRPALSHWHFNDGRLTLPDGLVVDFEDRDKCKFKGVTKNEYIIHKAYGGMLIKYDMEDVIAVKILGVTAEYGAQRGMEVVL
jgi:hypothetical protein